MLIAILCLKGMVIVFFTAQRIRDHMLAGMVCVERFLPNRLSPDLVDGRFIPITSVTSLHNNFVGPNCGTRNGPLNYQ